MAMSYHPNDSQYDLLRKILYAIEGLVISGGGGSPMVFSDTAEPSTDPGVAAAIFYRHDGSGNLIGSWWWDDSNTQWVLMIGSGTSPIAV